MSLHDVWKLCFSISISCGRSPCDAFERAATLMRMPDEAPPFPFFVVEDDL